MTTPVSVGDDGRHANPPDGEGPILTAIKDWFDRAEQLMRSNAEAAVLQAEQRRMASTPVPVPLVASGAVPASGILYLDLGAPQLGRRWLVRLLTVAAAASVTTAVAGAANWFTGQVPPASVTAPASGWRWPFTTLPSAAAFSNEQLPVMPSDHLYCAVSGGTAGQNIVAGAIVLDYPTTSPRTITTT